MGTLFLVLPEVDMGSHQSSSAWILSRMISRLDRLFAGKEVAVGV